MLSVEQHVLCEVLLKSDLNGDILIGLSRMYTRCGVRINEADTDDENNFRNCDEINLSWNKHRFKWNQVKYFYEMLNWRTFSFRKLRLEKDDAFC